MKRLLYLLPILAILLCPRSAHATVALVQGPTALGVTACSPTCTLTVPSTGTGRLLILYAENNNGGARFFTSVTGGGTWVVPTGATTCQMSNGSVGAISCAYVLSSTSGTTSLSVTMNTSDSYAFSYWEVSTTAAPFTLDVQNSVTNGASSTPACRTLTLTGANDFVAQGIAVPAGTLSALTNYANFLSLGTARGAVANALNVSSAPTCTWTNSSSAASISSAISFKESGTPQASTPTFSPVAGTYTTSLPRSVTVTCSTGPVACYNFTGSPATNGTSGCTTGTLYSTPVPLAVGSSTLSAVCGGTGFLDSTVGSAAYTITPTWLKWAGINVGFSAGNIKSVNGKQIGAATGNYGSWNKLASPNSAGTFSIVQNPTSVAFTAANSVVLPLTATTAAGNLLVFAGQAGDNGAGTSAIPISISAGGTLVNAMSCLSDGYTFLSYVLPSASTAASTSITLNFSATTSGRAKFYEIHPSSNGSLVGLDNCQAILNATSTTPPGPTFTWSGSNDGEVQHISSPGATPSAISAPYGNTDFASGFGWGVAAAPTTSAAPTWTLGSSVTSASIAGAFGFSVSAAIDGSFNDFEAGTLGSAPAAADLASSMHGWRGCQWQAVPVLMIYAANASMPLLNATGRFYGDGVSYPAGAGSKGLQVTWDGVDNSDSLKCVMTTSGTAGYLPVASMAFKYNDNFPSTDASSVDCGNIHGHTEFAGANCYGTSATRFVRIETSTGGNGANISMSGGTMATSCGAISSALGCTIEVQYDTGGTVPTSVSASVTGAVATFTGTFSPSKWPVGFAFTPTGCTGGTNYNSQLFYITSVTTSTITTSSTGFTNGGTGAVASGSATTCTLTAQQVLSIYSKTGTFLGVSFAPSTSGVDFPENFFIGNANAGNIPTSGKISQWDSVQISLPGGLITP